MPSTRLVFIVCLPLAAAAYGAAEKKPGKANEKGTAAQSCAEQKKRYRESEACFAKYRGPDRKLRPEAFSKCSEMKQPQC